MALHEYLLAVSTLLIVTTALLAGPVLGIPHAVPGETCAADEFPGNGGAAVTVTHLPETAVIERARFGAKVWRNHPRHLDLGVWWDFEHHRPVDHPVVITAFQRHDFPTDNA